MLFFKADSRAAEAPAELPRLPVAVARDERPARLRIALLGTRGVPARYGGFETAVEEIGWRLAERGHDITVYCRRPDRDAVIPERYRGMRLVSLPAVRTKATETVSHSALSTVHAVVSGKPDVVFVFNSANAVFLPLLRSRHIPAAVHVDGCEWQRAKWSGLGKRYYRVAESLAVRWADALIADAPGIADYYRAEFDASTELLSYGAPVLEGVPHDRLADLDLVTRQFHLVVARFEPENHVELIVRGYQASSARLPLVVVGAAPYGDAYTAAVRAAAGDDPRIRLVGSVWDQEQLNQLYAHTLLYLHGHSVGGTNPSLLRAMGAGAAVAAYDVRFNRDVMGGHGEYFGDAGEVSVLVEKAEQEPERCTSAGRALQARIADRYRWDDVANGYERLAERLVAGLSRKGETPGRRAR